jgi:rRNA maturation endonuclease Nob1
MNDREKVIKELQGLSGSKETMKLISDAIALLKEQEPILLENQHKPYGISTNANSPWISRCPRCSKKVEGKQTRFCKYCGQAVKWK